MTFVFFILVFFIDHYCEGGGMGSYTAEARRCKLLNMHLKRVETAVAV